MFIISIVLQNMISEQRSGVVMHVYSDRDGSCCILRFCVFLAWEVIVVEMIIMVGSDGGIGHDCGSDGGGIACDFAGVLTED